MYLTTQDIIPILEKDGYRNPRCKLQALVRDGTYIPIIRGFYETDPDLPGRCLTSVIRSPSYISFRYAMNLHGMIPDGDGEYTSATSSTHRTKRYDTPFGIYTYRDVPAAVFGYNVQMEIDHGYQIWVAEPEKAICDQLYTMTPVRSLLALEALVIDRLRTYDWALDRLDMDILETIAPLYRSSNTDLFLRMMRARRGRLRTSAR